MTPDRSALKHRPTRHSYSSIKKYLECPRAYYYSYIERRSDPPSAPMMRGTRLHKLAEDYMNAGPEVPVPYDIKKIGLKIYQLRERKALAEAVWLIDANWLPVVQPEDAKIKAIIDVHRLDNDVLIIHDYKSGREYPSHADQLEFYAAVGLCKFASAKRAESSAIYIDSGREGAQRGIIREMLPYFRDKWGKYIDRMDSDDEFAPVAGRHCERCNHSSKNGGPCTGWALKP